MRPPITPSPAARYKRKQELELEAALGRRRNPLWGLVAAAIVVILLTVGSPIIERILEW
jgi:hypothetical protein